MAPSRTASAWIPTARSIRNVREVSQRIPLIATGGLRSGVDVAKAIALGADIGSMARPMLVAAVGGSSTLDAFIERVLTELRICMFGIGASTAASKLYITRVVVNQQAASTFQTPESNWVVGAMIVREKELPYIQRTILSNEHTPVN